MECLRLCQWLEMACYAAVVDKSKKPARLRAGFGLETRDLA